MATADEYAAWIVKNADKKGTPEFDTVAAAYTDARQSMPSEIPGARAAAPELTTTQKVYQAVRPYAAPLIEGAGAIGAGLIGAGAGTLLTPGLGTAAGAVAGSGLGYSMGKELMNLGDIYLGGQAPRQGAAQVTEPVKNILEGATYEAGGRAIGPALGFVAGKVADLRQIPLQKAARIAKKTLGDDLPAVLNNLRNAPANASVAELTAGIENPAWQTLIQQSLERDPAAVQMLRKMAISDEAGAVNALSRLAGGTTATEVRGTLAQAKNALNSMTGPQREAALNRANLGQSVAEYEAQAGKLSGEAAAEVQKVRDLISAGNAAEAWARLDLIKRNLPVGLTKYTRFGELAQKAFTEWSDKAATASLDLGQGARFAQATADALRSVGIKPLEGTKLAQRISSISNNPEFAGNDLIAGAVKNVADDIAKWTGSGGVIDARALEAIRKNSVNAAIAKLRPGVDATTQRNLAAGVMSDIKPMIDNAIEGAGGAGWKQYLTSHADGMRKIAEKKLTGEALNLWKTNKDGFVKLVQGETPDAVEKILGPGSYDIAKELSDSTLTVLRDQARKHLTKLSVASQASEGTSALATVLDQEVSKFKSPSFLTFWSTVGNKALGELERKVGTRTLEKLTEAMKTPEGAANLLNTLPGAERIRVIKLLSNPSQWKTGSAAAAVNMLAPESTNQNALAQ
jgi:hypothetical protein